LRLVLDIQTNAACEIDEGLCFAQRPEHSGGCLKSHQSAIRAENIELAFILSKCWIGSVFILIAAIKES